MGAVANAVLPTGTSLYNGTYPPIVITAPSTRPMWFTTTIEHARHYGTRVFRFTVMRDARLLVFDVVGMRDPIRVALNMIGKRRHGRSPPRTLVSAVRAMGTDGYWFIGGADQEIMLHSPATFVRVTGAQDYSDRRRRTR